MRRAFVVAVGLLCSAPSVAAERLSKKQVSESGQYAIWMRTGDGGGCRVVVAKEDAPLWSLETCVGTAEDQYFVSNDGQRFFVVRPLLAKGKAKNGLGWTGAEGVALYDREGTRLARWTAGSLVPKRAYEQVRELGSHVKWLEGVLGVPGKPPRVTAQGLELEALGGKTHALPFDVRVGSGKKKRSTKE